MAARLVGLPMGIAALVLLLAACGGGGSSGTSPPAAPPPPPAVIQPSAADTSRLLDQATFGVTQTDVAHVQAEGFAAYLAEQLAAPASRYTGFSYTPHTAPVDCRTDPATPTDASSICARDKYSLFQVQRQFFMNALNDPDQLRQRVAFALSQIFVVSGIEVYEAYGMANYQNMLLNDAFGNFRDLLQDVTLSPVMGRYLDMAANYKSDPARGTAPNENYGREVLQLMSIGLYELNPDGSQQLDNTGAPMPTYDQSVVIGFAAAFTGWTYAPMAGATSSWANPLDYDGVMVAFDSEHEPGPKTLLNGFTVPAGQTSAQDLKMALDDIFNHPNVGPFIGKQLIQHLVTSNPSPAYVARISAVFADNGSGVRGDMAAVVKAILTDPEARGDTPASSGFGHLREPALFITSMLRSLGGQSDGVLPRGAISGMGQPIYTAVGIQFLSAEFRTARFANIGARVRRRQRGNGPGARQFREHCHHEGRRRSGPHGDRQHRHEHRSFHARRNDDSSRRDFSPESKVDAWHAIECGKRNRSGGDERAEHRGSVGGAARGCLSHAHFRTIPSGALTCSVAIF
ncbi:MAG TPA: DUF1800 domain-containing protein [Steroidobacteraceae bacterium]